MNKFVVRGCTLAVVLLAAGSAAAADMALKAPFVPPFSWGGWFVGANIGYGWGSDPATLSDTTSSTSIITRDATVPNPTFVPGPSTGPTTASGRGNVNPNGVIGGLQAGRNWQSAWLVYGLEADIQGSGQRGSITICDTVGCPAGSGTGSASYKLPWFSTFRGRIGVTPAQRWLVYATGGLAVGEIDQSLSGGPVGAAPAFTVNRNTTRAGYAVGGGVEAYLLEHWSFFVEYLFLGYGNLSVNGAGPPVVTTAFNGPRIETITTTTTTANLSTRIGDNIVRGGANFHF